MPPASPMASSQLKGIGETLTGSPFARLAGLDGTGQMARAEATGPNTGARPPSSREQLLHAGAELLAHGDVTLLRMATQRLAHGPKLRGDTRAGRAVQQVRLQQQGQRLLPFRCLQFTIHMRVQMLSHRLTGSGIGGAVGGEWRSGHTWGWTRCERRNARHPATLADGALRRKHLGRTNRPIQVLPPPLEWVTGDTLASLVHGYCLRFSR